jgi:flagellar motor switch protein FliN/FliY
MIEDGDDGQTDARGGPATQTTPAPARASRMLPDHLLGVRVDVEIVLGHLRMSLAEVAALGEGALLALDRKLGDCVDVAVNGRVVARGEVIALEGEPERLGVAIREIVAAGAPAPARRSAA